MRSKMAMSSSTRELFAEGVRAALESWPVLQIAVDNGFGGVYGQQKADWMVDIVQQYFHDNADLQEYEVEDFISELIDQEFNTVVDDGSLPQVCQTLCQLYRQCQQGALAEVRKAVDKLAQRKSLERAKVTAVPTPDDQAGEESEESEEDMECDGASGSTHKTKPHPPPPPTPEEDDGWTVVRKKK